MSVALKRANVASFLRGLCPGCNDRCRRQGQASRGKFWPRSSGIKS